VAGVVDIAAMKLLAVSQGGTRSDFVDLYTVLQTVPFRTVARNALERYGVTILDPLAVGKGLVWFEQANVQEDPVYIGTPVTWDRITDFFRSSVRQFVFDLDAERQTVEGRLPTD
jgi:hypothetical protein